MTTEQSHQHMSYVVNMLIYAPFPAVINIGIPVLVALLTVPTFKYLLARKMSLAREYTPLSGGVADIAHYQDRNGDATEASTRAFVDFRSMLTLWLGVLTNFGASITVKLIPVLNSRDSRAIFVDISKLSSWEEILLAVGTIISRPALPSSDKDQ